MTTDTLEQNVNYLTKRENEGRWFLSHPDWSWVEGWFETESEAIQEKSRLESAHITVYMNDPISVEKR